MTIVVTGGGSGGHITPILAVASELKRLKPAVRIVYVGQKGDGLSDIPAQHPAIDEVYTVSAGKFRRYHGEGWRQLLDVPEQLKNVRDGLRVLAGMWQSYWLLRKLRPSIIFTRGGFVSVPVAFGGHLNGIPYITHDSDSVPSLANRIIARWARLHAVALPEEIYPYPINSTLMVGIPLGREYVPVTSKLQHEYRQKIGLEQYEQILFVTGGGNGARQLNDAVIANAAYLLKRYPKLAIVHVAGRPLEAEALAAYDKALPDASARKRVQVKGFITNLYLYSGAADVIVARGGATNLAEFAVQGKACVIVPASQLTGGHQVKNANALAIRDAIRVLTEDQSEQERRLAMVIGELFDDEAERRNLGVCLSKFARPHAARRLAMVLLEQVNEQKPTHKHP